MDIDFVQMKNVSVQGMYACMYVCMYVSMNLNLFLCMYVCMHVGSKFRFQVPRHILLANASAAALAYINNTNSSNNNSTNGIGSGISSATTGYEPCMCVLEFTSMINIAIVREKIVPLIQSRQQLLIQSVS